LRIDLAAPHRLDLVIFFTIPEPPPLPPRSAVGIGKMVMAVSGRILGFAALGCLALAFSPAFGQTAPKALVASQPSATLASAPVPGKRPPAGQPRLTNSWICASGMRLEIYPVSFDDPTTAQQFVVVYKQNGGVVASERIDARTAKQFPAYGCNDSDLRDRSELLG
jgi:hypothetical protein